MGNLKRLIFLFLAQMFLLQSDPYWLIREDAIKIGKKEFYVEQVGKQKKLFTSIAIDDMENPRMVFLMPIKDLASLQAYPPFVKQNQNEALNACLHFQVFSLHVWLEQSSKTVLEVFTQTRPYCYYAIYDVTLGGQSLFEEALAQAKLSSSGHWCAWRSLLAGDTPSYVICVSFTTKELLKEWSMDKLFDELSLKDILRNKKTGWMKKEGNLSSF